MSVRVEELQAWHFAEWGAPIVPEQAIGYVFRKDGEPVVIAAVCLIDEPYDPALPAGWWAFFDSRGPVSPLAHRYAVKVRNGLAMAGAECCFAEADPEVPRAAEWLERLGFERTENSWWRLDFVVVGEGGRAGDLGQRLERGGQASSDRG